MFEEARAAESEGMRWYASLRSAELCRLLTQFLRDLISCDEKIAKYPSEIARHLRGG